MTMTMTVIHSWVRLGWWLWHYISWWNSKFFTRYNLILFHNFPNRFYHFSYSEINILNTSTYIEYFGQLAGQNIYWTGFILGPKQNKKIKSLGRIDLCMDESWSSFIVSKNSLKHNPPSPSLLPKMFEL